MKKIAVILSGCGHRDGAEITEAVSALIALAELGVTYEVFAPDEEFTALNHFTGEPLSKRNMLQEAARIARGKVKVVTDLQAENFDALVIPGGYGVATSLCTFAKAGANCEVMPEIKRVITDFYEATKPICGICIAPVLLARVLGKHGITVTLGTDVEPAVEIQKTGAHHENCAVTDYISDREHKIITTPAYMYGQAQPHQIFKGISGAIKELVEMA